ncbi:MAG TPA: hypothetical protein PLM29_04020 [Deltaproteobacteria bacterium]|nr:hypothetical protein [Deltaproteobacteria bacterium]
MNFYVIIQHMGDNSFTSILILLVLFIILPSVLKFIGQYTLGSKNASGERPGSEMHDEVREQGEMMEEHPSENHPDLQYRQPVDNRPINPKWF